MWMSLERVWFIRFWEDWVDIGTNKLSEKWNRVHGNLLMLGIMEINAFVMRLMRIIGDSCELI